MSEVDFEEQKRDGKVQYEIGKFISSKWPKPVTYDEIKEAFKSESEEKLKDFLQTLQATRWVVAEENGFTPDNMMLAHDHHIVKCRACGSTYPAKHIYHAGFSNEGFLYCDRDTTVVTFSSYDKTFQQLQSGVMAKHPWVLGEECPEEDIRRVESHLIRCPCGGKFSFSNPLVCPSCKRVLMEPMKNKEIYFVVLGRWIDGEKESIWEGHPS